MLRHFVIAAALVTATPSILSAQADQDYWPEVIEGSLDQCSGIPGIARFGYWNIDRDGRWKRYIMTETCYSPEDNWFVGSETVQGMEKVNPSPGFMGRYVVLSDGEVTHKRRTFDIGPLIDEMSEDAPSDDPEIFSTQLRAPTGTITRYEGTTDARMTGWVYRTPLKDLQAVPEGLWWLSGGIGFDHRTNISQTVEPDGFGFEGFGFLVGVRPEGLVLYPPMGGSISEPQMQLDVTDGHISGSLNARAKNQLRLEMRNPDAWDNAEIQINRIFGRFAEEKGQPIALMVGTGRIVLHDEEGQTAIDNGHLTFVGRQISDEFSDDVIRQAFPDFPGR